MAYQPNIPQATDQLSKSQGDLLGNFQSIQTTFDFDHVDFNAAGNGSHNKVTLPIQAPAPAFILPTLGLYASNFVTTGTNEIFFSNNAGKQIPFSNSGNIVVAGITINWMYLPSGFLLKWAGNVNCGLAGNANVIVSITSAGMPDFTAPPTLVLTTIANAAATGTDFVNYVTSSAVQLTFARKTTTNNLLFQFMALGLGV